MSVPTERKPKRVAEHAPSGASGPLGTARALGCGPIVWIIVEETIIPFS